VFGSEEIPMPTLHHRDRVEELTDVPLPASAAPNPLILADESTLVVGYISTPAAEEQASLVVFKQCFAFHFGLPNEEAFATHPLADQGLRPFGAFELVNSSWIAGLELRNREHPRHDPQVFDRVRHWVWTFQESVLECAAVSYAVAEGQARPMELFDRMEMLLRSGKLLP
jgi:hypothetical protein